MFCPQCGKEAVPGTAFCVQCGSVHPAAPGAGAAIAHPEPAVALALADAPAAAPAEAVRYGGFWRRALAFLIDGALLWVAGGFIQVGMGVDVFDPDWTATRTRGASLLATVLGWLYCALLESSVRQATLGQQILDLRVTDIEMRRISFARATGRHFGQILSAVLLCVGYLMIAFTSRKQGLHDMMAGCLVVRAS